MKKTDAFDSNFVVEKLRLARSVVLSTHRHCDGDGLGAQLALFHGLRKIGINARILNVDHPATKYAFLGTDEWIKTFDSSQSLERTDLALIFDTNDSRLVEPLFSALKGSCDHVLFVDHHPVLNDGPLPTKGSFIDTTSASTGEIVFRLLKELTIELDQEIARALYTSIVFDTQSFRYVKSDPRSHLMAAELLIHEKAPEDVHRYLFSNYSTARMAFLGLALSRVEYFAEDRLAFMHIAASDLDQKFDADATGDVIDLVMNIESIEAAALIREEGPGSWKVSLRSRGNVAVLPIAESLGGGGHLFASGAYVKSAAGKEMTSDELKMKLLSGLELGLQHALNKTPTPEQTRSGSRAKS